MKTILSFLILVLMTPLRAQIYSYPKYQKDCEIAGIIKQNFQPDTISKYIVKFVDRLSYHYYLYMSVLAEDKKNTGLKYLDTAFSKGLNFSCIPLLVKNQYTDEEINLSYRHNYLKAFDLKLKARLDSLVNQDAKYRNMTFRKANESVIKNDSIDKLQRETDSSNIAFLKYLITKKGYPTAQKIGYDFCTYYRTSPELIIQHLGTKEREFQIATADKLIKLCERNEENWQKAEPLIFNLHFRFSSSFSEFSFLYFQNENLDIERSLFSLTIMARLLQTPFEKMIIKCNSRKKFEAIKEQLVSLNFSIPLPPDMNQLVEKFGISPLKRLDESQLVFEKDTQISSENVLYKINYPGDNCKK